MKSSSHNYRLWSATIIALGSCHWKLLFGFQITTSLTEQDLICFNQCRSHSGTSHYTVYATHPETCYYVKSNSDRESGKDLNYSMISNSSITCKHTIRIHTKRCVANRLCPSPLVSQQRVCRTAPPQRHDRSIYQTLTAWGNLPKPLPFLASIQSIDQLITSGRHFEKGESILYMNRKMCCSCRGYQSINQSALQVA